MKKGLTQIQKQETFIQEVKKQYCEKFNKTVQSYCNEEFQRAFLWLEVNQLPEAFTHSKTFWNWWKLTMAQKNNESIRAGKVLKPTLIEFRPYTSTLKQIKDESLIAIT
ncbi:hypothetical protein [Chryseobacterium carnipullorum]|uniref:hypothetical protein n=1 Tax=Chryseobacterium carnipullorum TaxID=1124835 RepID=UPI000E7E2EE4|nr:hypothetical protein [Chryseobacterium carnipullorum]HBV14946.1 hypothetical protein [Chryseobacterium carnipullorum]